MFTVTVCLHYGRTMFTSMAKEEGAGVLYYKKRPYPGRTVFGNCLSYREGSSMSMDEYVNQLRQMNGLKKDTIHTERQTVVYFE